MKAKSIILVFGDFSKVGAVNEYNPGGLGASSHRVGISIKDLEPGKSKIVTVGKTRYVLNHTGGDEAQEKAASVLQQAFVLRNLAGKVVDLHHDGAINVHEGRLDPSLPREDGLVPAIG